MVWGGDDDDGIVVLVQFSPQMLTFKQTEHIHSYILHLDICMVVRCKLNNTKQYVN